MVPPVSAAEPPSGVLSEQVRELIRAEEIFREEIRKEIGAVKPGSALWKFLNTALGPWLLSTVAVGIGGWLASTTVAHHQQQIKERQQCKSLRAELDFRLLRVQRLIVSQAADPNPATVLANLDSVLLDPSFEKYTFRAVLYRYITSCTAGRMLYGEEEKHLINLELLANDTSWRGAPKDALFAKINNAVFRITYDLMQLDDSYQERAKRAGSSANQ